MKPSKSIEHYNDRVKRLARFAFISEVPAVPRPYTEFTVITSEKPKELVNWKKEGF